MNMIEDLSKSHLLDFFRWVSNKKAVEYSLSVFLPDRDISWVEDYLKQILNDRKCWNQVIKENGHSIGYCGFSNISDHNRSAEYFILIGDDEYWGKGIGTQVGSLVMEYGFGVLKLHRIWLTVSDCNHRAIKSYEKLGFQEEGKMREACQRHGAYHDKIVMGLLHSEWPNKSLNSDG